MFSFILNLSYFQRKNKLLDQIRLDQIRLDQIYSFPSLLIVEFLGFPYLPFPSQTSLSCHFSFFTSYIFSSLLTFPFFLTLPSFFLLYFPFLPHLTLPYPPHPSLPYPLLIPFPSFFTFHFLLLPFSVFSIFLLIYKIKLFNHINMLAIAGQTAKLKWVKFQEEPHGYPGGDIG